MHITGKVAPLAIVLALAGCGGKLAAAPQTPLGSAVAASPAPTPPLSPRLQFVLDYRRALAAEGQGSSASDAQLYRMGKLVCNARANGASQASLMGIGGNATILNRLADRDLCPRYQ